MFQHQLGRAMVLAMALLFCCSPLFARQSPDISKCSSALAPQIWLQQEVGVAIVQIAQNISPIDARPGAIVAAQTRHDPNYYRHWVRDAGLVIQAVLARIPSAEPAEKEMWRQKVTEYIEFSKELQKSPSTVGLGEVLFQTDGSLVSEPWGRPQNDGPAIRASSFMEWAEMSRQQTELWPSIIKDLDYVSEVWDQPSFDLWEDVKGHHFYTLMVQRRALLEGAKMAAQLNDLERVSRYQNIASLIARDLETKFWDEKRGYFVATLDGTGGFDKKTSQLDVAVLLGLLHGRGDDLFKWNDPRVRSTVEHLIAAFKLAYPINQVGLPGVAIGRYPEDTFAGPDRSGGNPWVLATLAVAQYFYHSALEAAQEGQGEVAKTSLARGDEFIQCVQVHANPDGGLNEQIQRRTGFMTSVSHLTWNYAEVLMSSKARGAFERVNGR